ALGLMALGIAAAESLMALLGWEGYVWASVWGGVMILGFSFLWLRGRQRLVINGSGIITRQTARKSSGLLPWIELSAVQIKPVWVGRKKSHRWLFATPKRGSRLLTDERAKKFLVSGKELMVASLDSLSAPAGEVEAALIRYSGGRYRG